MVPRYLTCAYAMQKHGGLETVADADGVLEPEGMVERVAIPNRS